MSGVSPSNNSSNSFTLWRKLTPFEFDQTGISGQNLKAITDALNALLTEKDNPLTAAKEQISSLFEQVSNQVQSLTPALTPAKLQKVVEKTESQVAVILNRASDELKSLLLSQGNLPPNVTEEQVDELLNSAKGKWAQELLVQDHFTTLLATHPQLKDTGVFSFPQSQGLNHGPTKTAAPKLGGPELGGPGSADPALNQALFEAGIWLKSLPSSDTSGIALANDFISEIRTLITGGKSMSDLVNWVDSASGYGQADVFMKFPGVTSQDASMLYGIARGATGNTEPTTLDNWYGQVWRMLYAPNAKPTSTDIALFSPLLNYIKQSVGSMDSAASHAQWTNYASYVLITCNLNTFQKVQSEGNGLLSVFLSTTFTQPIGYLMNFKIHENHDSPVASSGGQNLCNYLFSVVAAYATNPPSQSGQGTWALQGAIDKITGNSSDDFYLQFPGVVPIDAINLWNAFGIPNPPMGITDMDNQAAQVYNTWINGSPPLSPGSPDYLLAEALITEMQSLGSNSPIGSNSPLQSWGYDIMRSNFAAYPNVSAAGKAMFESLVGIIQ